MSKNPFDSPFNTQIALAESLIDNAWKRYSNITAEFDTSVLPEDPEDSFRKELDEITFDEEIWSTEDD